MPQARLLGYQTALFDNGILYNPDLIVEGDWTRDSGYNCLPALMNKGITAVFYMNDLMAGGVYDRLAESGLRVGTDLSVVGYDNRELSSYYNPPLTTISLPLHDIGYRSGEIMIELLEGKKLTEDEIVSAIPCSILIRESVKQINNLQKMDTEHGR